MVAKNVMNAVLYVALNTLYLENVEIYPAREKFFGKSVRGNVKSSEPGLNEESTSHTTGNTQIRANTRERTVFAITDDLDTFIIIMPPPALH